MTIFKSIGIFVLTAMIIAFCLNLGERLSIPAMSGFVSTAEAYTNRTISQVNVAGVAQTSMWGGCNASMMTTC
jgi:hypothetical protein